LGVTPVTLNKKDTQDYYFLVLRISGPRFRQKSPRDHSKSTEGLFFIDSSELKLGKRIAQGDIFFGLSGS
jgi:hypothetical protein